MRFYILLIIAFAIAISSSAYASVTEKREPSVNVCSKDITSVQTEFATIARIVNEAQNFGSIKKDLNFVIIEKFKSPETSCCKRFASNMNGEDANTAITFLSPFVDEYANMVSAFIYKNPIIEKDETILEDILDLLRYSRRSMDILSKCLIPKPRTTRTPAETALFDKINKVYSEAKGSYPILGLNKNVMLK